MPWNTAKKDPASEPNLCGRELNLELKTPLSISVDMARPPELRCIIASLVIPKLLWPLAWSKEKSRREKKQADQNTRAKSRSVLNYQTVKAFFIKPYESLVDTRAMVPRGKMGQLPVENQKEPLLPHSCQKFMNLRLGDLNLGQSYNHLHKLHLDQSAISDQAR